MFLTTDDENDIFLIDDEDGTGSILYQSSQTKSLISGKSGNSFISSTLGGGKKMNTKSFLINKL